MTSEIKASGVVPLSTGALASMHMRTYRFDRDHYNT